MTSVDNHHFLHNEFLNGNKYIITCSNKLHHTHLIIFSLYIKTCKGSELFHICLTFSPLQLCCTEQTILQRQRNAVPFCSEPAQAAGVKSQAAGVASLAIFVFSLIRWQN